MARPSKYGNMPTAPQFVAKVKGDAGVLLETPVNENTHRYCEFASVNESADAANRALSVPARRFLPNPRLLDGREYFGTKWMSRK